MLVEEDLVDDDWLAEHANGLDELRAHLAKVPIAAVRARVAGVAEADVRAVARRIAAASSVSIFEDLGIQQAPHSTLNSYLEKLLYLLTGNFAKPGGDEHPHPHRQPRWRRQGRRAIGAARSAGIASSPG